MTTVARIVLTTLALGIAGVAYGQDAGAMEPHPLRLQVGESVAICSTGTIVCPAAATLCDDLSVVSVGADERGPVLRGIREGTTLCSSGSASGAGFRRVYRVTVVPKPAK
jgi:hypothetical protein